MHSTIVLCCAAVKRSINIPLKGVLMKFKKRAWISKNQIKTKEPNILSLVTILMPRINGTFGEV